MFTEKQTTNPMQNTKTINQPWIEKYRPSVFDDIVLDTHNRTLFANILDSGLFPHLLFYGPGGTGKTTTAMALIRAYQLQLTGPISNNTEPVNTTTMNRMNMIVLNASDDRGIDVIRTQIQQFAQTSNMFGQCNKFVVLDEVDAMTKTAQTALKIILQTGIPNVRFCLICNYISRIDESLRNEFICVRFNQLPPTEIYRFIRRIADSEQVDITDSEICSVQELYKSDIRSMVNFIQLHQQDNIPFCSFVVGDNTWKELSKLVFLKTDRDTIKHWIYNTSTKYNLDIPTIFTQYFNYVIKNSLHEVTSGLPQSQISKITPAFLTTIARIIHMPPDTNIQVMLDYFILCLMSYHC